MLDADLNIRSYFGKVDFGQQTSGVQGKNVREINTDWTSTTDVWQADTFKDKTSKYEPFEQVNGKNE